MPVPLSPSIRMVSMSDRATSLTTSRTRLQASDSDTMSTWISRSRVWRAAWTSKCSLRMVRDFSMSFTRSAWSTGLPRKSMAPSFMARTASSIWPTAVMTMTTVSSRRRRLRSKKSRPLPSGREMSSSRTSGWWSSRCSLAVARFSGIVDVVADALELLGQGPAQELLVFDNQDQGHCSLAFGFFVRGFRLFGHSGAAPQSLPQGESDRSSCPCRPRNRPAAYHRAARPGCGRWPARGLSLRTWWRRRARRHA